MAFQHSHEISTEEEVHVFKDEEDAEDSLNDYFEPQLTQRNKEGDTRYLICRRAMKTEGRKKTITNLDCKFKGAC